MKKNTEFLFKPSEVMKKNESLIQEKKNLNDREDLRFFYYFEEC